jgi:hypothetical protein
MRPSNADPFKQHIVRHVVEHAWLEQPASPSVESRGALWMDLAQPLRRRMERAEHWACFSPMTEHIASFIAGEPMDLPPHPEHYHLKLGQTGVLSLHYSDFNGHRRLGVLTEDDVEELLSRLLRRADLQATPSGCASDLDLLCVQGNQIVLPRVQLSTFCKIRRAIEAAGGHYTRSGIFTFDRGTDASAVLARIRDGAAQHRASEGSGQELGVP